MNPTVAEGRVLVFRELDQGGGTPGRQIAFSGIEFQPLGYGDLANARLHDPITIPLDWRNARIVQTDIQGLDIGNFARGHAVLESPFTSRAVGLVRGGWLPSAFATISTDTIVLVDRNVVSEILGRFEAGLPRRGRAKDFLDLFANQSIRINPLLYAIEGNGRSIPTPEIVRDQLKHAVAKLQAALPSATLTVNDDSLRGAIGLIEESRVGMECKRQFLIRIAPSLVAPVSKKNFQARWDDVLHTAAECSVPSNSLVVIAALSSVAVPNGRSPARKLLKFKGGYTEQDAYNALADLRSLDILMYFFALFPDKPLQLCTADKNLALFWTGIRACDFARNGNGIQFNLSPIEELFPNLTEEQWRSIWHV